MNSDHRAEGDRIPDLRIAKAIQVDCQAVAQSRLSHVYQSLNLFYCSIRVVDQERAGVSDEPNIFQMRAQIAF
jgi:hypothetical protein